MLDPFAAPVAKHGVSLARMLYRRFFPPKYGHKVAPRNLLEVIGPHTYEGKVFEILGQPDGHSATDGRRVLAYRFSNALLQVDLVDHQVETVALAAPKLRWPNRFEVFPFGLRMGRDSYGDIFALAPEDEPRLFQHEFGARHSLFSKAFYFAYSGRYLNYHFACINAPTYPRIEYEPEGFEWDENGSPTLRDDMTKFNAVAITARDVAAFPFRWEHFT